MATYGGSRSGTRTRGAENQPRPAPSPRAPLWAKLCVAFGAIIMVVSGAVVVVPRLVANWATGQIPHEDLIPTELRGNNIDGSINVLLLGLDERTSNTEPAHTDSIIIVHVPATHDQAYMISIPRDTQVTIPPFPANNYLGGLDKINAAFTFASEKGGKRDDTPAGRQRGTNLVARTLSNLVPGGLSFNAVVIINFEGFKKILNAIDGVDMCVDEETRSIHYDKNDKGHTEEVPYAQRKVYPKGCYHLKGWEALDFSRQRHFDDGADYVRQRHQQQLLMAIFKKLLSKGTLTDPGKVSELQKVAGDLLTVDLGNTATIDWIWTLKGITANKITLIKTNGGRLNPVGNGREALTEDSLNLLKSVHDDNVADFLASHPTWIVPASK
jgi:LCP family protein required for cell wall assembly